MQFRKFFASLLLGGLLLSLSACQEDPSPPPPPTDNPFIALQDRVADLYNTGIEKLTAATSYTMTGSFVSAAEVLPSSELTSNLTRVEMNVANGTFYSDSESNIDPHTTYFDGTHFYYSDATDKYFTNTNDRHDYTAIEYLPQIFSEIITNPQITENADGSKLVKFTMAFDIYQSEAVAGIFGITFDNDYAIADVLVTVSIDADGYITNFILSFDNQTDFADDAITQNISVNMMLTNYNQAEVVVPSDIDVYENWIEDFSPDATEPIVELTPEDLS